MIRLGFTRAPLAVFFWPCLFGGTRLECFSGHVFFGRVALASSIGPVMSVGIPSANGDHRYLMSNRSATREGAAPVAEKPIMLGQRIVAGDHDISDTGGA
jgi:hypothetical protein